MSKGAVLAISRRYYTVLAVLRESERAAERRYHHLITGGRLSRSRRG
eukprot:COSAG02_NODE_32402_length_516_cov_83.237410_2_plen_46_part_01